MLKLLSHPLINGPFLYLVAYAIFIPTFDNVHYYFLLNICKLRLDQYDILCILPYLGIGCGTIFYLRYMRYWPMRSVILLSLFMQVVYTAMLIFNVKRWNNIWMVDDFWFNIPLFFFSKIF